MNFLKTSKYLYISETENVSDNKNTTDKAKTRG